MPAAAKSQKTKSGKERQVENVEGAQESVASFVTPTSDGAVGEEEVLLKWISAVRPFKKRDSDFYTTIGAIAFLVIVILLFLREYLLIAVVIAFAFVSYVLAAIPPEETEHQLTNRGIRTGGKLYRWGELLRYWISEKYGQKMIMAQTELVFPGQLLLMMGKADEKKVRQIFNERLPYEEPEPTFLDKSASWLSENVPLEKETAEKSS